MKKTFLICCALAALSFARPLQAQVSSGVLLELDKPYVVNPTADAEAYTRAIAVDANSFAIYGGNYKIGGVNGYQGIARTDLTGAIDPTFNPTTNPTSGYTGYKHVEKILIQPDGKILVGGLFSDQESSSGTFHFARLNADGSPDNIFNSNLGTAFQGATSVRDLPSIIYGIAMQSDGKIIIVGDFTTFNGASADHIVRLNPDGTRDNTFNSGGIGFNGTFTIGRYSALIDVKVIPKGFGTGLGDKILLTGGFEYYNGEATPNYIVRLNEDGTLDDGFNRGDIPVGYPAGHNEQWVNSVLLQLPSGSDPGGLVVYGNFKNLFGATNESLARLKWDGEFDGAFSGTWAETFDIIQFPNGKLLTVGANKGIDGVTSTNRVNMLNADGTPDTDYNFGTGFDKDVNVAAIQPGVRKVLFGGIFQVYNGEAAYSIARLEMDKAMPVTLGSFSVYDQDENVFLKWETKHESESSHFEIERSSDGKTFAEIGFVPATNNSNGHEYVYIDEHPLNGKVFYRLKSVGIDGKAEYSKIVALKRTTKNNVDLFRLKSNVVTNDLELYLTVVDDLPSSYAIFDIAGKLLQTASSASHLGSKVNLNISGLSVGTYFIRLQNGPHSQTIKFVKQRM